jgi:hypothetical protein
MKNDKNIRKGSIEDSQQRINIKDKVPIRVLGVPISEALKKAQ